MPSLRSRRVHRLALSATLGTVLVLSGCGGGGEKSPTAPSPPTTPGSAVPLLTSFTIGASEPSVPGQNTAGRLTLSAPAVSPVVVTLTASDNQAVTVPPSITVSGGAVMATVPILTRRVPADTDVTVTASANDSSVTSSLRVGS
jgi:hypothetical protein